MMTFDLLVFVACLLVRCPGCSVCLGCSGRAVRPFFIDVYMHGGSLT